MKVILVILGVLVVLWASGGEAKDFKFPEITGWKQSVEIQTFSRKHTRGTLETHKRDVDAERTYRYSVRKSAALAPPCRTGSDRILARPFGDWPRISNQRASSHGVALMASG